MSIPSSLATVKKIWNARKKVKKDKSEEILLAEQTNVSFFTSLTNIAFLLPK